MPTFQSLIPGSILALTEPAALDPSVHRWSQQEIDALTLAHAAQRPLLVRGEPGTGKTQLARAAAEHLGWALLSETVHPRFEPQDLVYRFDAVRRLADAQSGKLSSEFDYWQPGPLWRAYGWASACRYGSCRGRAPSVGHVILIDEIDKADSDLPNSLLEVLGQRSFNIAALRLNVGGSALPAEQRPLVIVTTNEERELPAAFLRRCIVLSLAAADSASYREWLIQRAEAHFGARPAQADQPDQPAQPALLSTDEVIAPAADQLLADRAAAVDAGLNPPGPAEFLDLLYALHRLAPNNAETQRQWIAKLSAYAFIKHGQVNDRAELSQQRKPLADAQP